MIWANLTAGNREGEREMRTKAAKAAAEIRKILKKEMPGIKFSVRSQNYAGGNSIDVSYDNGPVSESVEQLIGQYQYGHFDGMDDCYYYSNRNDRIPQVKFLFVRRDISEDVYQKAFELAMGYYADLENCIGLDVYESSLEGTPRQYLWRNISRMDLTTAITLDKFRGV